MSPQQTDPTWHTLAEFTLSAGPDSAHLAVTRVAASVRTLGLLPDRLEQLIGAVSEAVSGTLRQRHPLELDLPLKIQVFADESAGQDALRCWGFFLIARTAERLSAPTDTEHLVIQIFLYQDSVQPREPGA